MTRKQVILLAAIVCLAPHVTEWVAQVSGISLVIWSLFIKD